MALNPFSGFAKYRRAWMAAILLLCMGTFVLCTGTRGDFSDWLLQKLGRRGTSVATIAGSSYSAEDFNRLKSQRNLANDYMRIFGAFLVDTVNDRLKDPPKDLDDQQKQAFGMMLQGQQILSQKLKATRFFEGGVENKDLVEFRIWLAEADRLGIRLTPQMLAVLINGDIHRREIADPRLDQELERRTFYKLQEIHHKFASPETVSKAIEDEYRVRMAKLAISEYQLRLMDARSPKRVDPLPWLPAVSSRVPLTPAEVFDNYQKNRSEFDVALLPVPATAFVKDVAAPNEKLLDELFAKHKAQAFDPSSETPGFRKPHLVRVQWVTADAGSKHFKSISKTANALASYPIGWLTPQMPLATAFRFAASGPLSDEHLLDVYDQRLPFDGKDARLSNVIYGGAGYLDSTLATPMAAWLSRKDPNAIAALVGACARPDFGFAAGPAYWTNAGLKNKDLIQESLVIEHKRRLKPYATVVGTALAGPGFAAARQLDVLADQRVLMPLPLVRNEISEIIERGQASGWVTANMQLLRKKLEAERVAGSKLQVERVLERYGTRKAGAPADPEFRDLGLEVGQTEKFYDRYTIQDAPELKPLRDAFEQYAMTINFSEGRGQPGGRAALTPNDFYRLFFDGGETFSATSKHVPKAWPPSLTIGNQHQILSFEQNQRVFQALFQPSEAEEFRRAIVGRDPGKTATVDFFGYAEKPFLFWKSDEKAPDIAATLDEVRDKVVESAKLDKARDLALNYAESLAKTLLSGNADYATQLQVEGDKRKLSLVRLPNMAPLFPKGQFGQTRVYDEYPFPKDLFQYPREDMAKNALTIFDLKGPVQIKNSALDNINQTLYNTATTAKAAPDKFVQILTNRPRDTFYVAVVERYKGVDKLDFFTRVVPMAARLGDAFFEKTQMSAGEEFRRSVMEQLQKTHRVRVEDSFLKPKETDGASD